MHRINKFAAFAGVCVLLLTSAMPDFSNRVLMRVGGSTATISDYRLMFGNSVYPTDTVLAMLATHLRTLEDARITLGIEITEDTFLLGRLVEIGDAKSRITDMRTTLRAKTDSAERAHFFASHPQLFSWKEPHFIGSVVLTQTSGSAKAIADSLRSVTDPKATISKKYRVITYNVARGMNPYVDFAAFGLSTPLPDSEPWRDAAVIQGDTLSSPTSPQHVAELLTTLLADSFYTLWIDSLATALSPEIDSKSLDFIKNNVTH